MFHRKQTAGRRRHFNSLHSKIHCTTWDNHTWSLLCADCMRNVNRRHCARMKRHQRHFHRLVGYLTGRHRTTALEPGPTISARFSYDGHLPSVCSRPKVMLLITGFRQSEIAYFCNKDLIFWVPKCSCDNAAHSKWKSENWVWNTWHFAHSANAMPVI